ncbi:putative transcriptional regulator [Staphylococcus aureus]|nr:putative transcriptional regulator [Staphylococcus aureus]
MEYEYPIDLDWSNEEMISVINFFNHVEKYLNPA